MVTDTRSNRLRQVLADRSVDGAVLRRPANVRYLTGYAPTADRPCFAVVGPDEVILVAPHHEDAARTPVEPELRVVGYAVPGGTIDQVADADRLSAAALEAAIGQTGLEGRRVGIEETAMSAFHG